MIWEAGVYFGLISGLFFPSPSVILQQMAESALSGKLFNDLSVTFFRFFTGFFTGGFAGLIMGLLMGWSQRLRLIIDPFVSAFHPMPKIAMLPLFMIVFGIGETSKIILIAVVAFFPVLINTMAGVRQINPIYFEVAQNYGTPLRKIFIRVVLPGSLPMILTGFRLALNGAFVVTIATELLTANTGLGATIWLAWQTLQMEELYVALITTGILGIGFNQLIQYLESKLIHWQS